MAQLLNNMNVWMVVYCAKQLLGLKKIKNLLHLSLSKAGPFTLGSHICVKALKCKVFQIEWASARVPPTPLLGGWAAGGWSISNPATSQILYSCKGACP